MIPTYVNNQMRGVSVAGQDIVLLAAGQSNEIGWGTGPTNGISYTLDLQDTRLQEYIKLGPELIANNDFTDAGMPGWTFTSGASGAVVNGQMKVTKVGAGSNIANYTISGLTAGHTYEIWMKVSTSGIVGTTQFSITTTGVEGSVRSLAGGCTDRYLKKRITAAGATQLLQLLWSTATEANGSYFTIDDIHCAEWDTAGGIDTRIAIEPLYWPNYADLGAYGTSPAFHMATELLRQGANSVKIIPTAWGGTQLYGSVWEAPAGARYTYALDKLTTAVAAYPASTVILSWIQGEADGIAGVSGANYKQAFKDMVAGFRAVAPTMKVVMGSMVPEYIDANAGVGVIDTAHKALPAEMTATQFASMIYGYQIGGDPAHYTAPGDRIIGKRMGQTYGGIPLTSS